ncbi:DUF4407 domain-containing protein [Chitinophaga sp.]|uniref:DUF4407 domain-containing protein n=1 Tax=Chitinophaga sp. TaxID=1869181 RepID=UPI0031DF4FF2
MNKWWLRTGCFLTGYNYNIVRTKSEVVAQTVKKYTSALLIVCILWAFVGYNFTHRYLRGDTVASIIGAVVLLIIVIQIERQIIMGTAKNNLLLAFRFVIGLLMAGIGSLIIDQIIFKDDIDLRNISLIESKVSRDYPAKAEELKQQIAETDSAIQMKERLVRELLIDINKHPMINSITTEKSFVPMNTVKMDSSGNQVSTIKNAQQTTVRSVPVPNPNIEIQKGVNQQIDELRKQKQKQDNALIELRNTLLREYKSKTGFLDEIDVMVLILKESTSALFIYILWIILLLGLELFIVASKFKEEKNDYDETIAHQMELQKKMLLLMKQAGEAKQ